MNNTDYIDNFFKGSNSPEEKASFEQRIVTDSSFAEEVAFYVASLNLLKEQLQAEKKINFRKIYEAQKETPIVQMPVKKWWRYVAAASIFFAVVLAAWFFSTRETPQQLAGNYIQQNFTVLNVTMGSKEDSLQTGLRLFNQNKFPAALQQFESILKNDSTNDNAKKYAGIVCLRLGNYDKAINYFRLLEWQVGLYSNPGKLYHALSLLKRNKNDDKAGAKILLQQIIEQNAEGKETAEEWMKKL